MYKILLVDIDNTLLDFNKAEKNALKSVLKRYNLFNEENIALYSQINLKYWRMFEKHLIDKSQVVTKRWEEFFAHFQIEVNPEKINVGYFNDLKEGAFYIYGAEDFLKEAVKIFKIYAITNGATDVQKRRIAKCGLNKYLSGLYISEEMGLNKPDKAYFDYVLNDIGVLDKKDVIVLGDSLTSDIQGALNSSLDYVWFDLFNTNPSFEGLRITKLADFFKIINK